MGKIEVKGTASRMVDYDSMKIRIEFHAKEITAAEASEKMMRESEDFLGILKSRGIDISEISILRDSINQNSYYRDNRETEEDYSSRRSIEIISRFDMKMINSFRAIAQNSKSQVSYHVDYFLSNEDEIREELFAEAIQDAKKQAAFIAEAIDQKLIGLISAEINDPKAKTENYGPDVFCMALHEGVTEESYDNSDQLSTYSTSLSENIYTTWEIG